MVQKYPRNTQLDQRLDDAAARLRKGTPLERESFIRRPREAESAPHVIELANSPSIEPPEQRGTIVAPAESNLNRFLKEGEDCIQEAQTVLQRDKMAGLLLAEDWMEFVRSAKEQDIQQAMPGWKQEEDDRLRDMAARGASAIRIAGALNRKIQLVRVRARFLGCPLPRISDQRRMLKQYDLIGRSDWGGQVWYPKTTQFRRYHSGGLP